MNIFEWWQAQRAQRQARREWRARLQRGVDEVVNIVDPRLRGIPGYRSRLAPALERAAAVADSLAASLPEPLTLTRDAWATDPVLRAFFSSVDEMQAFFNSDRTLRAFLSSAEARGAKTILAAIGMQIDRRTRFGVALQGEVVQHDREQVAVSFSNHRIGVLAADEAQFRNRLRRRVLEEIATRAMQRIMGMKTRKESLTEEKATLRWKLKIYELRRDGMGALWHDREHYERHIQQLRAELGAAETGLDQLMARAGNVKHFLQATVDELEKTGDTIILEPLLLYLDAMNLEVEPGPGSHEIHLSQVRVGRRRPRIIQLIRFSPDFVAVDTGSALRQAARALGVS